MKEREPIEAKGTHCPMCERPLDGVYDYPKIKIRMLTDVAIPKVVLDVPKKDNIAAKIKRFKEIPEVDNFLNELSLKETGIISLSNIRPHLPEYQSEDPDLKDYYKLEGKYYLHILDSKTPNVANISVMSHVNTRIGWGFVEIAKLAEIHYEGLLTYPQLTPV